MGIFEKFQMEDVLLIYCLYKKNFFFFSLHKVFKARDYLNKNCLSSLCHTI